MTHDNVDCLARHIKNNGLCGGWQISLRQQLHDWLLQINTNEGPRMHVLSFRIAVIYHLAANLLGISLLRIPTLSIQMQSHLFTCEAIHLCGGYSLVRQHNLCGSNFSTFLASHLQISCMFPIYPPLFASSFVSKDKFLPRPFTSASLITSQISHTIVHNSAHAWR